MSCYNEWVLRGINNRNYNIFKKLISDPRIGKIFYIDYIPVTKKRSVRNFIENFITPIKSGTIVSKNLHESLTALHDKVFVYSTIYTIAQSDKIYERIKKHVSELGFGNIVTWSFFPFLVDYMDGRLGQQLNVFDAVDNWAEHPSYPKYKDLLLERYAFIDTHADIIFTVSKEQKNLFSTHKKAFWVPNGIDSSHFQKEQKLITRDIGNIKKPIIGYTGTIQERFDVDLVYACAKARPEYSFVLIGPTSRNWKNEIFGIVTKDEIDLSPLQKLQNVFFLGRKSYDQLPMYVQQFDVGIIPHKNDEFVKSNNPMKMYDYLAAGLPIVATPTSGAELFPDIVTIASTSDDFVLAIDKFVNIGNDERNRIKTLGISAAEEHSWESREKFMVDEIFKLLPS